MLYVLDTDVAGFLQSAHLRVLERLRSLPADSIIVTTIVTFGEDLSGWMPACRRAADGDNRMLAFARLQRA